VFRPSGLAAQIAPLQREQGQGEEQVCEPELEQGQGEEQVCEPELEREQDAAVRSAGLLPP